MGFPLEVFPIIVLLDPVLFVYFHYFPVHFGSSLAYKHVSAKDKLCLWIPNVVWCGQSIWHRQCCFQDFFRWIILGFINPFCFELKDLKQFPYNTWWWTLSKTEFDCGLNAPLGLVLCMPIQVILHKLSSVFFFMTWHFLQHSLDRASATSCSLSATWSTLGWNSSSISLHRSSFGWGTCCCRVGSGGWYVWIVTHPVLWEYLVQRISVLPLLSLCSSFV